MCEEEEDIADCTADDDQQNINYGTALQEQLEYLPFDDKFEIDPPNLKLVKILGSGYFGDVHLGLLTINGSLLPVAVKTPKSTAANERMRKMNDSERDQEQNRQREALRDEVKIMSFLPANANVIKLLGAITTSRDDFCVVIEYCEFGGIDSFLRGKYEKDMFIDEFTPKTDSEGYLIHGYNSSSVKVLHRDVALRNVLLKSDFTIRVSDFGLSRRANEDGSYIQSRNLAIPFRYIAPESLRYGRFSPQSESWSFGVVLWELFTFARHQPYSGTEYCDERTVSGILNYLHSGKRLQIPMCTPTNVAKMMTELWHEDPVQRPTFRICQDNLYCELLHCNPLFLMHANLRPREKLQGMQETFTVDDAPTKPSAEKYRSKSYEEKLISKRRRLRIITGIAIVLLIQCIALPVAMYFIMQSKYGQHGSSSTQTSRNIAPIFRNQTDCSADLSGDRCLECLCIGELERCQAVSCIEDEDSKARGIFQITLPYYQDCGKPEQKPGETLDQAWQRCTNDIKCSMLCIKTFVKRYSSDCQQFIGCEKIIRLHHGGPYGCSPGKTDDFWKIMEQCINK